MDGDLCQWSTYTDLREVFEREHQCVGAGSAMPERINERLTRFDLLLDDPEPVFAWITARANAGVVRKTAFQTVTGWHMKIVFDDATEATAFGAQWESEAATPAPNRR